MATKRIFLDGETTSPEDFVEYFNDFLDYAAVVDDALVGSAAVTNAPDDEELTISFGIQNGEAVAKVLNVDFIRIVAER